MNKNILIDGGNIIHRAFHAFVNREDGRKFASDSGYPIGMIYGPLSMLADWLPKVSPNKFSSIGFFCDGHPTRRREMDPEYKRRDPSGLSDMVKTPIELIDGYEASNEIDVLLHILRLLGVSVFFDKDEEADDLIASFVREHSDDVNVIVSSDKDFFQLLTNPRVAIYIPGIRTIDAEASEEYWASLQKGKHPKVSAASVRMFKTLCGDPSDNIPGIPRLRKKVAATVSDSPTVTLDKLKNTDWPGFSDLERERAREMFDRLKLNWELVGLVDTLPLKKDCTEVNVQTAKEILRSLNVYVDVSHLIPAGTRATTVSDSSVAKIFTDIEI